MQSVLLFSKDVSLVRELTEQAVFEDFEVDAFVEFKNFQKKLRGLRPELVVVDVQEYARSMISECLSIKNEMGLVGTRFVMILPEKDEDLVVLAFHSGVDDCVFRPLRLRELVARMKTVMRRGFPRSQWDLQQRTIRIGKLEVRGEEYKAFLDGRPLELTKSEFKILYTLASHPKRVYTRQQLLDHCGSLRDDQKGRSVDVHVRSLRKKMGDHCVFLKTARGVGYYMEMAALP